MDGQIDPRWLIFELYLDLTQTNIQTKFESSWLPEKYSSFAAQRKCGWKDSPDGQTMW